jgi:glucoamylase
LRWRHLRHLALAGLAAALIAPLLAATRPGAAPPLFSAGLLGNDQTLLPVTPADAEGAAYVPGSNVLRLADGGYRYLPPGATEPVTVPPPPASGADPATGAAGPADTGAASETAASPAAEVAGLAGASTGDLPLAGLGDLGLAGLGDLGLAGLGDLGRGGEVPADPGVIAAVAADRKWLATGVIPGKTGAQRGAAARALLDLRLLLRPGGAALAAQTPYWAYAWPRDASFVAAAFAVTGHRSEAVQALGFLGRTQRPDGSWAARSRPDGTPVNDGRLAQLDATGWVSWAAWLASAGGRDLGTTRRLWPMVQSAAEQAARSLGRDGLPPAGPDYWERPERLPTLGTAAALRAGLRSAGDLAASLGHGTPAARYRSAAARLSAAISRTFWGPAGFHRYPTRLGGAAPRGDGPDVAVTWLGPPFAPSSAIVRQGLARATAQLAPGDGGAVPGTPWRGADYWTPATASFALAEMASGQRRDAQARLDWLLAHRTALGAFPERVRRAGGTPRSVAPLAWTDAIVLLTLASGDRPLPIPGT